MLQPQPHKKKEALPLHMSMLPALVATDWAASASWPRGPSRSAAKNKQINRLSHSRWVGAILLFYHLEYCWEIGALPPHYLQMIRFSLRNNKWFKFQTSGRLPIHLEDSYRIFPNLMKKNWQSVNHVCNPFGLGIDTRISDRLSYVCPKISSPVS
jgi:hypothetical protein